jgi:hypothetical protein
MEEAEQCDRLVMMAAGRVVAEGTAAEIVGDGMAVEVVTANWTDAFDVLERAGLTVALVGASLRVAGADLEDVRRLLADAGLVGRMRLSPATLDETFALLTARAESLRQLDAEQADHAIPAGSIAKAVGFAAAAVLLASGTFFVNRTATDDREEPSREEVSGSSSPSAPIAAAQPAPTAAPSPQPSVPAMPPAQLSVVDPAPAGPAAPSQPARRGRRGSGRAAPVAKGAPVVAGPSAPTTASTGSTISSHTISVSVNGVTMKRTFVSSSSTPPK